MLPGSHDHTISDKEKKGPVMVRTIIVEDNAAFRKTIKEILAGNFPAMSVSEAAEGNEAFQQFSAMRPDLVIMDVKLPGENGFELTRRLKSLYPRTIVVILTSQNLPEYKDAAYRYGADFFMSKGTSNAGDIISLVRSIFNSEALGNRVMIS
jgi:DNA-binding NarL/FixJ family response regulator